jgi:hypothetical protein
MIPMSKRNPKVQFYTFLWTVVLTSRRGSHEHPRKCICQGTSALPKSSLADFVRTNSIPFTQAAKFFGELRADEYI